MRAAGAARCGIAPVPRIASRALMQRFSSTCSTCTGIELELRHRIFQVQAQVDGRGQRRAQQLAGVAHQVGQRHQAARAALAAAEGQHLRDQLARALRRVLRALEVLAERASRRLGLAVGGERQVAEDALQDVVEVVRDAAGELADGFHLLRLAQLRLELRALGVRGQAGGHLLADLQHVRLAPVEHRHQAHLDHESRPSLLRPVTSTRTCSPASARLCKAMRSPAARRAEGQAVIRQHLGARSRSSPRRRG
jgi:hypothetical protein